MFEVPDTGERNVLFVVEGAVDVRPSLADMDATLVSGESKVFRGGLELSVAETEPAEAPEVVGATVVVGLIASDTAPPGLPTAEASVEP